MNAVIASGESQRSQAWAEQIAEALQQNGLANRPPVLQYVHWTDSQATFDLDRESQRLAELFEAQEEACSVFAKSIGTVTTFAAITRGLIRPASCVYVGTPSGWEDVETKFSLARLLYRYGTLSSKIPSLFIQATADPAGGFRDLISKLHAGGTSYYCALEEIPGDDHDYVDVNRISSLAARFMLQAS